MKRDEALIDLIVIDVCISCYDDPFLDPCLRYSSFHRLTIREQKEGLKSNVHTELYGNNLNSKLFILNIFSPPTEEYILITKPEDILEAKKICCKHTQSQSV